ncbi:MAG: hypothetical protein IT318_21705 [Anaerolineales bacterium]|nr:hypothetical protein [Anaerolineales bacterium]
MPTLLLQAFGLLLLLAALALGTWRWIRPRAGGLGFQAKGLLFLLVTTLVGGLLGSPFWWIDDARSFAWDLPPLASRMLASAGWAFAVAAFLALEQPRFRRVRLVLILLVVYLGPLAAAALVFHRDRFDFAAPLTYAFLGIAALMLIASLWYLLRQPRVQQNDDAREPPPTLAMRVWLVVVAGAALLWGLALFVTDGGPVRPVWAWPGDLLSSRLIGVMLLAIGVGALAAMRHAGPARMMLAMAATYGLGVVVANAWNLLGARPVNAAYVTFFGLMALGSLGLLALPAPRPAAARQV